ncbi:MAG: hypothetical protein HYU69_07845 [Bacteroidetes bacterium]|nr:hypothetical protein [Bacteroidota bacterium]
MLNSKLIGLIKLLSIDEIATIERLIPAIANRDNPELLQLFRIITKAITNNQKELTKEYLHKQLFGSKKFREQKISNMMTELLHNIEDCLGFMQLLKDKQLKKIFILKELREKNADKHFESLAHESITRVNDAGPKTGKQFYFSYANYMEFDMYSIQKGDRKKDESLQMASDNLELYFIAEKLRLTCEMLNRKNIIGADYDIGLSQILIELLKTVGNKYLLEPIINIYYRIFLTIMDGDNPEHYKELFRLLEKNGPQLSRADAHQLYEYAQNYCIKKVNTGNINYIAEIFNLYQQQLDSGTLLDEGKLSEFDYKNIVAVGLRLGKFNWTHDFIEYYKNYIASSLKENAYTYNLASYYYHVQNYKPAIRLLQDVEFTDVFYHLGAKLLLFKMYYETEQTEPFYSLIDTFKIYLYRNKGISLYQRKSYLNLLRFTKKTFDLKINPPASKKFTERIIALQRQIETNQNIVSLMWLNERVEELKN